ncbi:hypothetical protein C8R44DRAFT_885135 [Mycena epipterygia]|nr:hypothetical protein C8R44DRAFT_885135 [Mycena epipterygia]
MPKSTPVGAGKKLAQKSSKTLPKRVEPPVNESQWRASTISPDKNISKTIAMNEYKLSAAHIEGLEFTKSETVVKICNKNNVMEDRIVPMILYNECAIERVAWRIRGGPEAFDA